MAGEDWTVIISSKRKFLDLQIKELIGYKDLFFLLIKRDYVVQYKQTILGPIWYILNPILSTLVFIFIFGRLANIGTDGIPHILFYYSGTMLWGFFSANFTDSSNIFIANKDLFGKIYFPRLLAPISRIFSNAIKILYQFVILMGLFIYFIATGAPVMPSWLVLLSPLLIIWLACIGTGAGIIISALTTKYRDLIQLVSFALGLAMFATPVVYPISAIPGGFVWLPYVNPVSAPIELFRSWFFGTASINIFMILSSLGITFLLVFTGLVLFNQNERNFIDDV